MLTFLGAPALLALETRSQEQLSVLDPQIRLARMGRAVPAQSVECNRPNAPKIYIFEFTKGRRLGGSVRPPRSSRIIVRFNDPGLENDPEFVTLSCELASAGAALLSGFNAVGAGDLTTALARTRDLACRWHAAGIPAIHLELAGYDRPEYRDQVLNELSGPLTSLGLSFSEFDALVPNSDVARGICALGVRFHLRRVCVHGDGWAAAATLDDPQRERDALVLGSLMASTRAAHGGSIVPNAIPAGAVFEEPPAMAKSLGAWHIVVCATPYLARPATTVGLGDTFTAGCLLVLGGYGNAHDSADKHVFCPVGLDGRRALSPAGAPHRTRDRGGVCRCPRPDLAARASRALTSP